MVTLTTLSALPVILGYPQHPRVEHTHLNLAHSRVHAALLPASTLTPACSGARMHPESWRPGTALISAASAPGRTGRAANLPTPRAAQIPNHSIRGRYLDTDTGDLYYFHNASGAPTGAFSATAVRPRPLPCPRRARHAVRISTAAKGSSCCCEHAWGVYNGIRV